MDAINDHALTFLINCIWQVAIVAATATICMRFLRRASARLQHFLWIFALLLSIGLPLYSLLQKPEDGFFNFVSRTNGGATQNEINSAIRSEESAIFSGNFSEDRKLFGSAVSTLGAIVIAFYFAQLFFRLFRFGKAFTETRHIRRTAYERNLSPAIRSAISRSRSAFGIKRIRVLCSPDIAAPVTAGSFRPVIILPENFFEVACEEMIMSAVGHETAHITRRDFALNLIYEFFYLFISFHPAARLVKRRIDETRELACDEMVAERLLDGGVYARSLVNLAAFLSKPERTAFTMGIMSAEILETRIKRLVNGDSYTNGGKGKLLFTLASFLLAATCGIASTFSLTFVSSDKNGKNIGSANDIAGVWRGEWRGLPGATLVIETPDKIKGAVTFYLLKKNSSGEPEIADDTGELPLIEPKLENDVLSFKLKRRQSEDVIKAKMIFTDEDEAVLKLESDEIKGGGNETKMRRDVTRQQQ